MNKIKMKNWIKNLILLTQKIHLPLSKEDQLKRNKKIKLTCQNQNQHFTLDSKKANY